MCQCTTSQRILAQYELTEGDQVEQEEGHSKVQKITEAIGPESGQVKGKLSRIEKLKEPLGRTRLVTPG